MFLIAARHIVGKLAHDVLNSDKSLKVMIK